MWRTGTNCTCAADAVKTTGATAPVVFTAAEAPVPDRPAPAARTQTEKDEPQPQVLVAFGLRITN